MKLKTLINRQLVIAIGFLVTSNICLADCYDDAASYHGVNAVILKAIAFNESSFRPNITTTNSNHSIDIGMTGINSVHLPELNRKGVQAQDLYDPCKSIYVSAWLLRKQINRFGNTWNAVGAYHSTTPYYRDIYAEKIRRTVAAWGQR
jgi:lysozyme-related protein Hpa2